MMRSNCCGSGNLSHSSLNTNSIQTRNRANTSTHWHFAFALCFHSNETRVPVANSRNSAQLGGTPYYSPSYTRVRAVVWACGRRQTDRQTQRRAWPIHISRRLRLTRNVMTPQYPVINRTAQMLTQHLLLQPLWAAVGWPLPQLLWWWHLMNAMKERHAWCCLQVKLCDPCLSALYTLVRKGAI